MKEVTVCSVTQCWSAIVLCSRSSDAPLCSLFSEEHKSSLKESQFFDLWEKRCGTLMLPGRAAMICMPRTCWAGAGPRDPQLLCCVLLLMKADHSPVSHYDTQSRPWLFYLQYYTSCVCSQPSLPKEQSLALLFSGPQPEKGRDWILTAHVSTQDQHLVLKDAGFPHEVPTSSRPEVTQTYFQCKFLDP